MVPHGENTKLSIRSLTYGNGYDNAKNNTAKRRKVSNKAHNITYLVCDNYESVFCLVDSHPPPNTRSYLLKDDVLTTFWEALLPEREGEGVVLVVSNISDKHKACLVQLREQSARFRREAELVVSERVLRIFVQGIACITRCPDTHRAPFCPLSGCPDDRVRRVVHLRDGRKRTCWPKY